MRKLLSVGAAAIMIAPLSSQAVEFKFNGFVKAEVIHSDAAVGSFGDTYTHTAISRANRVDTTPPEAKKYEKSSATSLQTSQSRFGFQVIQDKTTGYFEFDLIDPNAGFTNTTALQAQGPRTRQAFISHKVDDSLTVFIGQKWSTAAGIAWVGSYNIVGNGYQAGKVVFLNEEVGATYKLGNLSFTGAITGKGRNAGAINENELGTQPGLAGNIEHKTEKFLLGVAGHVSKLHWDETNSAASGLRDREAYVAKAYGSATFGSFKWDLEGYMGTNVNNLNALGIAQASNGTSSWKESGFWTNLTYDISKLDVMRLGYGMAQVDDEQESRLAATGLQDNQYIHANYGRTIGNGLTAFVQYTYHDTKYGTGSTQKSFQANVGQAGLLYKF